jgi:hypothetical protein
VTALLTRCSSSCFRPAGIMAAYYKGFKFSSKRKLPEFRQMTRQTIVSAGSL